MTYEEIRKLYIEKRDKQTAESKEIELQAKHVRNAAMRYYSIASRKMGDYHRLLQKSNRVCTYSWVRDLVVPLLQEVNIRTGLDFEYDDLSSFGLRAECPVFTKSRADSKSAWLIFTPSFDNDHAIFIDTGEKTNRYPEGSIGERNGYNQITEMVDSVETVIENLRRRFPNLELK